MNKEEKEREERRDREHKKGKGREENNLDLYFNNWRRNVSEPIC